MPHHHYWRHTPLPLNHIAAKTYAPITHLYITPQSMTAKRESEAIYHQFCQEQAQRKAALQEWFTHERIRLANAAK